MRHAQAQAYHHASNERAEEAGQQVKEILKKIVYTRKIELGRGIASGTIHIT